MCSCHFFVENILLVTYLCLTFSLSQTLKYLSIWAGEKSNRRNQTGIKPFLPMCIACVLMCIFLGGICVFQHVCVNIVFHVLVTVWVWYICLCMFIDICFLKIELRISGLGSVLPYVGCSRVVAGQKALLPCVLTHLNPLFSLLAAEDPPGKLIRQWLSLALTLALCAVCLGTTFWPHRGC